MALDHNQTDVLRLLQERKEAVDQEIQALRRKSERLQLAIDALQTDESSNARARTGYGKQNQRAEIRRLLSEAGSAGLTRKELASRFGNKAGTARANISLMIRSGELKEGRDGRVRILKPNAE